LKKTRKIVFLAKKPYNMIGFNKLIVKKSNKLGKFVQKNLQIIK